MMQSRRREHGSSGELDVFGATSYFAGGLLMPPAPDDADCCRPSSVTEPSADGRLCFQAKSEPDTTRMTEDSISFRGPPQHQLAGQLHDHAERHVTSKLQLQVVAAARRRQPSASGKSKLAALLSFMVSPSPRASFRKEAPPSSTRLRQAEAASDDGDGDEREPANNNSPNSEATASPTSPLSSRESSMQLQGLFGAHDDDDGELDLGVATGDRRLLGITVVRGSGGDEERWVVRCVPGPGGAWDDEERREKMIDEESAASSEQNIKDELVDEDEQAGDDGGGNIDPAHSWDSDSSSDLFDLDLEYRG